VELKSRGKGIKFDGGDLVLIDQGEKILLRGGDDNDYCR